MCGRYQHNRRKSFALLEIFDALTRLLHITRDLQKNIKKSNVLKIHKENARHKKQYGHFIPYIKVLTIQQKSEF